MAKTPKWTAPKPLCEKLQYLIGVPAQYIDNFEALNKEPLAEVRKLCNLRSTIIANFTDINEQFRAGTELADIKEISRLVTDVTKYGINIKNNSSLSRNVMELNELINEKMEPVSQGFKDIPAEWIQDMFKMPNGDSVDGVRIAVRRYRQFKNFFPYQKYVNWPFAETPEEKRSKNIFGNDQDLLMLLAEIHTNKSSQLFDFIGTNDDIVVVVDCENSDAQRLYNTLLPCQPRLNKVILMDDSHTNALWEEFAADFTAAGVTVEHEEVIRLKEQKSLVDIKMATRACEEYYQNNIRHFVLASSDSDIWALITSMPKAEILLLAEKSKCGDVLVEALTQNNILHVFMEDVAEESTDLMDRVMHKKIDTMLQAQCIDVRRVVISAAQKLNLYLDRDVIDRYTNEAIADLGTVKDIESGKILVTVD